MHEANSLNSSVMSSIAFSNQGMMIGLDQLPQPPVYRVEAEGKLFGDGTTTVQYLNKIQMVSSPDYHPFADKMSPFEEWKHTLLTVMETAI